VFIGLALLYGEVPELHGMYALTLLAVTFLGLIYVAQRQVRLKHTVGTAGFEPTTTGVNRLI
ncbi:MAG: hypothetical protein JWQ42_3115, partial [Edaphobacter sp.]|nr:hypothetical protein [Edaphobacter sp.]